MCKLFWICYVVELKNYFHLILPSAVFIAIKTKYNVPMQGVKML